MKTELPSLIQSLQGRDPGYLRIVAELWGLPPLKAADFSSGVQRLAAELLIRPHVEETIRLLPAEAREALDDLLQNRGRMPWALFVRRYGGVREMGAGKRDRESPYLSPVSPAEILWYRALFARDFFDTPTGLEEFAYIPIDLLALIPIPERKFSSPLGRAASRVERAYPIPAGDRILDHACTLLAALRLGMPIDSKTVLWGPSPPASLPYPLTPTVLTFLLSTADLLDAANFPRLEPVRAFLEASRGEALVLLTHAWLQSTSFNELGMLPGLRLEGEWKNEPLHARNIVLNFLSSIPYGDDLADRPYWNLAAFVAAVRQAHPDFQRPAGDYDSWFIRDEKSGEFLRGFGSWDRVDGALIRYLIGGPLHWLGIMELASTGPGEPITAFRFSAWANCLLKGEVPETLPHENELMKVSSDARLHVPRLAPRSVRYQVARFAVWEGEKDDTYHFRVTPAALDRARQQGLRLNHLLALLRRHAASVPPALVKALVRWEEHGVQARLERVVVLRVSSPELLQALRSSRAARFLGDPLGPTTIIVQPGAWKKVMGVLSEMGYLGEADFEPD